MSQNSSKKPVKLFIVGALIAGVGSALLNNLYGVVYTAITGHGAPEAIHPGSITGASIVPTLVAGVVYFVLSRFTSKATLVFIAGAVVLTLLSLGASFGSELPDGTPTPEGFAGLSAPMHLITGAVAAWVIPWWVARG